MASSGLFDAALPQSLYATLPNVEPLTMTNKATQGGNTTAAGPVADGYAAAKTVSARRRKSTRDELIKANLLTADNVLTFSVLNDGSDATFEAPRPEARFTDGAAVQWTVKRVTGAIFDTLFQCTCVQGW